MQKLELVEKTFGVKSIVLCIKQMISDELVF